MKNVWFAICITLLSYTNIAYGSEAGMPQLNPEFWAAQIFWLVIIFASLYLVIWKLFLPRITYSVENRKSKVVNDLDDAQKLKEKAEHKLQEYNEIIEKSKNDAKKIVEDSKKKLDLDIKNKKKIFDEEIEKEISNTEKEIKALKKSSILNIGNIATETTSEIIKKIINIEVNQSSVSAIVNDVAKKETENNYDN